MRNLLILLSVIIPCCCCAAKREFLLAENSRASLPIVVPSNADISTLYAAEELSKYLRLITGADFEIQNNAPKSRNAIRVGFPYKGEKKLDEIRIFVKEGSLHITGEGKRGILYATYRLLENVGCGFWAPDNETIPNLKKLSVPFDIDIVNAPAFEVRQPHGASTYNHPEWKEVEF